MNEPVTSYQEAELLAQSHWSDFTQWRLEGHISYDMLFNCLENLARDLVKRKSNDDASIHFQVNKFKEGDQVTKFFYT